MKTAQKLITFVVIATLYLHSSAQNRPGASGGGQRQGPPPGESSFVGQLHANDANTDGQLTFEEAKVVRAFRQSLFDAIDTDGSGGISMEEAALADKIDKNKGPKKRINFEGKNWTADHAIGAKVVQYKGKTALHIAGREQCLVYLPIDDFQDGVIEVDIAGDIFSGVAFRVRENGQRSEKLYFRPQNAGTERAENTVQYGVIGREDGHWRHLRTNFPGKYETSADIAQGEWFRAKFVIKGESLKVYVNGAPEPLLVVDPLLEGVSRGSVGVWGWDSYFANFKYTPSK